MYAGQVVEQGAVSDVLTRPKHPYTEGLLRSVAALSQMGPRGSRDARLPTIPGAVPDLAHLPRGCRFAERCAYVEPKCRDSEPPLAEVEVDALRIAPDRLSRCFFAHKVGTS
jgi:peptide/nickel transport system ATP-binding protein